EAQNQGSYQADSLTEEGFIHCSTRSQLLTVVNAFFSGRQGLALLAIDVDKLAPALVWENLEGGRELYPHLYGPLNLDAVLQVLPFQPEPDGRFSLPKNLV
ncbi:MAG TPA: DUF952 domain-containing protein, partial [Levilinea sp.]|nr:DUF952 domain-containing protein [Levilinea sp.]